MTSLQLTEIATAMKYYKRYQIKALSESGISHKVTSKITDLSQEIVSRWSQRDNIYDNSRSGRPVVYNEAIQLRTIGFYCQTTPLQNCGRWSLRVAGKDIENNSELLGLPSSHATIQRLLKKHHLKVHRSKYFLQITDPDFFPKMDHLIQLYLNPPEYLFCFDECPGIQVLQRLAPDLQTEQTKIRLEEFEYIRNGTMDVFAFLQAKTGNVWAECSANHTIQTLVEVFERHLQILPQHKPLDYVMDNLASHSSYELCKLVAKYSNIECPPEKDLDSVLKRRQWLQSENKRIIFHFTPFHGSWLNRVEIWFGILNQKCLTESFDSPESLYNAIYDFVNLWNSLLAHPFKWNYDGKGLQQKAVNRFINMLENSLAQMNVKFMTKQLLLMQNLIKSNQTEIKFESWIKLYQLIKSNSEQLNYIITKDAGPKRMQKAKIALKDLIDFLNAHIHDVNKKAA